MATKKDEVKNDALETGAQEIKAAAIVDPPADEAVTPAEREQLIYIGPPLRENGLALRTNQTFIGGRPGYYKALYDKYPMIQLLFVPVAELRDAQKQIKTTGTALNMALLSLKGV